MTDIQENRLWLFLVVLLIVAVSIRNWLKERKAKAEYLEKKKVVDAEREAFIERPVPDSIRRSIREFQSGLFFGEDRSPLAYIGYRVGKTYGLAKNERRERLDFCFRMPIPDDLPAKYHGWGSPASLLRYYSIVGHLEMLADQRRYRRNFEVAVAEWDADAAWFRQNFRELAMRYGEYGHRR